MKNNKPNNGEKFFDRKTIEKTVQIIVGTLIYSLGVVWFLNFGGFFAGGMTGISQLLSYAIWGDIKPFLGIFIVLLNLPLFLIGVRHISKKFAILTIISVALQSVFITFLQWLSEIGINPMVQAIAENNNVIDNGTRLLLAIIGGFVSGFGNALCLKSGGSSGGMDVIANALLVKRGVSFTKYSFTVDMLIIACSCFISFSTALFTIVRLIVSTLTLDRFYAIYKYTKLEVVTNEHELLRESLLKEFQHGVTIYTVIGGYTMQEKKMLEIIIQNFEMGPYLALIRKVDPKAFITVSKVMRLDGNYNKKTII